MTAQRLKETHIHKAVVDHWKATGRPGTLVATIPNLGAFGQHGLTKGLPDLMVIGPGVHGYIELKTEAGKLSQPQREFQALCSIHDIRFAVTHGRDGPIQVLKDWGIVA
ncbi:VRR-NUC domain-containing protein [Agrobacterium rosae]